MNALSIQGLRVVRGGREVVHGIDLEVTAGEVVALLGANGAGKSSTVLAVAGLLRDTRGTITAGTTPVRGRSPHQVRRAGVATMQEGHRVFTDISVADNLRIGSLLLPRKQRTAAIDEMFELFPEMRAFAGRMAGSLSGGQQQMLALATAMVARPDFLLVDEMSLGLAPVVVARLVPALRDVAARGVGVLLIEQFTHVALEIATRVTVLAQGHAVLEAPVEGLRNDPTLLSSAYRLTEHRGEE